MANEEVERLSRVVERIVASTPLAGRDEHDLEVHELTRRHVVPALRAGDLRSLDEVIAAVLDELGTQ